MREARLESGLPAAALARRALELAPENPAAIGCCATALAAEGQRRAAENLLVAALAQRPDWLEGQKLLATLRYTGGDEQGIRARLRGRRTRACRSICRCAWPGFASLRRRATGRRRAASSRRASASSARSRHSRSRALFIASESGDTARAAALFAPTADSRDEVRDLAWVRHCLRSRRRAGGAKPGLAIDRCAPSARLAWPYLSLIWRLTGDARAQWLDGSPPYVRSYDLEFAAGELEQLAVSAARAAYRALALSRAVRARRYADRSAAVLPSRADHRHAEDPECSRPCANTSPRCRRSRPVIPCSARRVKHCCSPAAGRCGCEGRAFTSVTRIPGAGSVRRCTLRCRTRLRVAMPRPVGSNSVRRRQNSSWRCSRICVWNRDPDGWCCFPRRCGTPRCPSTTVSD